MGNEEEGFEQWTARQVQDLERVNGEQTQALIELRERIKRLEGQTNFEASRLLERITALENGSRLVGTGGLIAEIMNRLEGLDKADARKGDRLSALEGYPRLVKPIPNPEMKPENVIFGNAASTMPADFKPNIEVDWSTAPEEFSPAIGRGVVPLDPETIQRIERDFSTASTGPDVISITGVQRLKEEMYERGYSAGISAAIDEAVSRVETLLQPRFVSSESQPAVRSLRQEIIDQMKAVVETKLGRQGPPDLDGHTPPVPKGR